MTAIIDAFKNGIKRIVNHPQLAYTIAAGVAIAVAFIGMTVWFMNIAGEARDDVLNVRAGAIQDTFVQFAPEYLDDKEVLRDKMQRIADVRETIREFQIIRQRDEDRKMIIDVALDPSKEGEVLSSQSPQFDSRMFGLAQWQTDESVTTFFREGGERMLKTRRAITNDENEVVAFAYIVQGLSLADAGITESIWNAIIVFILVIILVLALFLRHSKIIDYAQLYKRLKEVDQMKDDFISMASHELRTPLTHIRGYIDMLKGKKDISDETEETLSHIDKQAQQLDGLVADMLDVKRLEQGRMKFEMQTMQPHTMINEVIEETTHDAEQKGRDLSADIQKKASIYADPERLKQVLVNLVGNAVKYTEEGDEIVVKQYVNAEDLVIRVHDTGQGMSAEEQDQLFQKFSRVGSDEQKKHIKGTGLGLWITQQIVEQMNGTITVESIEGVGSDFIVEFPLAESSKH